MAHALTRWLLLALMAACNGATEGPFEGQQAPRFQGPTMTGGNLRLVERLGKPTVLVFWASWCGPCRTEAPAVAQIAASYGDAVNIVGINAGESLSAARRAAPQMGITWPVVMDTDGAIQSRYKVSGIPLVLILDQEGLVRHRNNGVPSDVHRLLDGLSR